LPLKFYKEIPATILYRFNFAEVKYWIHHLSKTAQPTLITSKIKQVSTAHILKELQMHNVSLKGKTILLSMILCTLSKDWGCRHSLTVKWVIFIFAPMILVSTRFADLYFHITKLFPYKIHLNQIVPLTKKLAIWIAWPVELLKHINASLKIEQIVWYVRVKLDLLPKDIVFLLILKLE